jgi:hypothetical protein
MEMAEMMERLLARMDANMKSIQKELRTSGTKIDKIQASHKEMMVEMRAWRKEMRVTVRKETMACHEKTETRLEGKEPTSVDM